VPSVPPPGATGREDLAVEVRGLVKDFGGTRAVDHLDLTVPRGAFLGLLGPNGAGKTTSLRMITGLLRPDAGEVLIDGDEVWHDPVPSKARIGVLPEDLRMFDRLRGRELLTYTGLLRGMDPEVVEARADELLTVLDLGDAQGRLVVDYSHGMRKKVALAAALLHAPRILFLDEPFEAVDPVSGRTIRTVLQRFTRGGGTVVLSSHVLALVEQLCDHVAIVHRGRLVAAGTLDEVKDGRPLEDVFVERVGRADDGGGALSWLGSSSD
jgi:ABC-2 type transport system ATP-binding protein